MSTVHPNVEQKVRQMSDIMASEYETLWKDQILFPAFNTPSRSLWQSAMNYPLVSFSNLGNKLKYWRSEVDQLRVSAMEKVITHDLEWDVSLAVLRPNLSPVRPAPLKQYERKNGPIPSIDEADRIIFSKTISRQASSVTNPEALAALSHARPSVHVTADPSTPTSAPRFPGAPIVDAIRSIPDKAASVLTSFPLLYLGLNVQLFMVYAVLLAPPATLLRAAYLRATGRHALARMQLNIFRMGRMRSCYEADRTALPMINPYVRACIRVWIPKGVAIGTIFSIAYFINLQWAWRSLTAAADAVDAKGIPLAGVALRTIRDAVPDHLYTNRAEAAGLLTGLFYARRTACLSTSLLRRVAMLGAAGWGGAILGAAHHSRIFPWGDEQLSKRLPLWQSNIVRGPLW